MAQIRDTSEEGLKTRMRARLDQLGWTLARVAEETEETYKNVQRWISGTTAVPADFIARYVAVVPVNPVWLLTNEGSPDPVQVGVVERAFLEIARIVDDARGLPGPDEEPGAHDPTEPEGPAPHEDAAAAHKHVEEQFRKDGRRAG